MVVLTPYLFCLLVAACIAANVPGVTVLKNSVPKAWSHSDIYCQLIENRDDNNDLYAQAPRLGAFEVSYKGVVSIYFLKITLTFFV